MSEYNLRASLKTVEASTSQEATFVASREQSSKSLPLVTQRYLDFSLWFYIILTATQRYILSNRCTG